MSGEKLGAADIREILRLLPHRYPFVMIDRIDRHARRRARHRHQERHYQRAAIPRPFSGQSGDARRAGDRRHGANGGHAVPAASGRPTARGAKCISSPSTRPNFASPPCRATRSNITSTRSRTAATCGGIGPRPRSSDVAHRRGRSRRHHCRGLDGDRSDRARRRRRAHWRGRGDRALLSGRAAGRACKRRASDRPCQRHRRHDDRRRHRRLSVLVARHAAAIGALSRRRRPGSSSARAASCARASP